MHDAQNKAQKNAAFPFPRGRDDLSAPKSARQEPKKNHEKSRPSSERSESVAVPGRFALHIWTESGMRGVPAMSKTLIKSPQVKSPHECAFPYPRRKDGAWARQARSKSLKGSQSCQGRVRKCRCARQISAETASTSRSRCCFTQNSPMKVRFLPKEAGTNRRPQKARVKGPKGSQNYPTKGPKVPPCQADFHGDSVDLT